MTLLLWSAVALPPLLSLQPHLPNRSVFGYHSPRELLHRFPSALPPPRPPRHRPLRTLRRRTHTHPQAHRVPLPRRRALRRNLRRLNRLALRRSRHLARPHPHSKKNVRHHQGNPRPTHRTLRPRRSAHHPTRHHPPPTRNPRPHL